MTLLLIGFSSLVSLGFFIYSYHWVDFNLTLVSYPPLARWLDSFQHWGYFHRPPAARWYLALTLLSFIPAVIILLKKKLSSLQWWYFLLPAVIAALAYPFLSHDMFNYLFEGRMVWVHRANPYRRAPQEFSADPWLRFMHWVHKPTPYGPVHILFSLIIAVFSFDKFIISYFLLKLINLGLFALTGYWLLKLFDKQKVYAFWFLNPFLHQELLMNSHNELLMISLAVAGYYWWQKKSAWKGVLLWLASVATKYISLVMAPLIFLRRTWPLWLAVLVLLGGFVYKLDQFQSWYLAWLWLILPFLRLSRPAWLVVLAAEAVVLVIKYRPFIATGSWDLVFPGLLMGALVVLAAVIIVEGVKKYGIIKTT